MSDHRARLRMPRRAFLRAAGSAAGAVALGFPAVLRAEPPTFKVGTIHPVTGGLAEPGQACRLGAQMAADAINAAGGIRSLGGMKLELLVGDSQARPDVGRAEAERVISQGARMLMGGFDSRSTEALAAVAQQRRIPLLVDIAAADAITADVAGAVRDGREKVQYVYRNFPTGSSFGRRAVQYFSEIFQEAGVPAPRVVLMHCDDRFGRASARGFQAAHAAAKPSWDIVDVVRWPEPPRSLSAEVARAKAARPDVIAPITRPISARLLLPELRTQRLELLGVVGPGSPGLYEAAQLAVLKEDLEYVMSSLPWPDFKNPRTSQVAEEYRRRSGGKAFDANSGYSYDGMTLVADILERARSTDPEAIVQAMKSTDFSGGLMQYAGPVVFDEIGDNPNAVTTLIQILGQKPVAVWPREAALEKLVFPRPRPSPTQGPASAPPARP